MLNLAPHQSGSIESTEVVSFSMHHTKDDLSGNNIKGLRAAFSSDIGDSTLEAHKAQSFNNELKSFLSSFFYNTEQTNQSMIDRFIKLSKDNYGIEVTIED